MLACRVHCLFDTMASRPQRDQDFGGLFQRILVDFFKGTSPDPVLTGIFADFFVLVCLHPFTLGLILPFAWVNMHHVLFHYSVGLSIPAHSLSQLDLSQRWIFSSSTEKSVGANLTFTQASNLVQAQSLLWPQPPP